MQLKNKFTTLIEDNDLRKRSRKRKYVNQRGYVIKLMRGYGFSYIEIGEMLGLNHATCIHAFNNANLWESINDRHFFNDTEHLRAEMNNYKITRSLNDLYVDVKLAGGLKDLENIQERMRRGEYQINFNYEEQNMN
jgi:DNA-binding CsgD family transcriptional regulator